MYVGAAQQGWNVRCDIFGKAKELLVLSGGKKKNTVGQQRWCVLTEDLKNRMTASSSLIQFTKRECLQRLAAISESMSSTVASPKGGKIEPSSE